MEEEFKVKPAEEFMYDLYTNHAMNGIISTLVWSENDNRDNIIDYTTIAEAAFDLADAMIKERRKRKNQ